MKRKLLLIMIVISIGLSASEFSQAKNDCSNNIAKACHTLGYIYAIEKGNEQRGIKAYLKGASLGYTKSYLAIAYIYSQKGDSETERKYLKKGCNNGSALGCGLLGQKYFEENNYHKAHPLLKKACYSNSKSIDEKSKQDSCEYLEAISNTVIGKNTDKYRNCIMENKFSANAGAICFKEIPKSLPSLLSEKNEKAMKKCLADTHITVSEPEEFCALRLGLKYMSSSNLYNLFR